MSIITVLVISVLVVAVFASAMIGAGLSAMEMGEWMQDHVLPPRERLFSQHPHIDESSDAFQEMSEAFEVVRSVAKTNRQCSRCQSVLTHITFVGTRVIEEEAMPLVDIHCREESCGFVQAGWCYPWVLAAVRFDDEMDDLVMRQDAHTWGDESTDVTIGLD